MADDSPEKRAYDIARRFRKHSDALAHIILIGLAEDKGEADQLIAEGQRLEETL